jgi:hypothetical protein
MEAYEESTSSRQWLVCAPGLYFPMCQSGRSVTGISYSHRVGRRIPASTLRPTAPSSRHAPLEILTFQPCTNGLSRFHSGDLHVCPRSVPQTRMPKTKWARVVGNCSCQWVYSHGGFVMPRCDMMKCSPGRVSLFSDANEACNRHCTHNLFVKFRLDKEHCMMLTNRNFTCWLSPSNATFFP